MLFVITYWCLVFGLAGAITYPLYKLATKYLDKKFEKELIEED